MTIGSISVRSIGQAGAGHLISKGKSTIIQRPQGKRIPHSGFGRNALWICMRPMEIEKQTTGKGGLGITFSDKRDIFKFLAPAEIMETLAHGWEEYESMTSRLQEKLKTVMKLGAEIDAIGDVVGKVGKILTAPKSKISKTSQLRGAITSVKSDVVAARVDTPLVYQSSERREWNFTFQLLSDSDPIEDVVWPVKEIMRYSCPEAGIVDIDIKFPYVFKLYTEPGGLFFADYAALTSVQPTWKEPYRHGYPTSCDLTLTFKDMSPVFRSLIARSRLVNVPGADSLDKTPSFVRKAVRGQASEAVSQVTRTLPQGLPAEQSYVELGS
jgi:hypothetical protein